MKTYHSNQEAFQIGAQSVLPRCVHFRIIEPAKLQTQLNISNGIAPQYKSLFGSQSITLLKLITTVRPTFFSSPDFFLRLD